jgi:hypothetical protein
MLRRILVDNGGKYEEYAITPDELDKLQELMDEANDANEHFGFEYTVLLGNVEIRTAKGIIEQWKDA